MKKKRRKRKQLDWSKSIEEQHDRKTVTTGILSLVPPRLSTQALAANSIFGMLRNDIAGDEGQIQRCPKCHHRSLRKLRPEEKGPDETSNWRCFECGNDCDEFGNTL